MPTEAEFAREMAIAAVERQLAEMQAADESFAAGLAHRTTRKQTGPSVVFSLRLDRHELAVLERRAAAMRVRPSVLARNLIREGLADPNGWVRNLDG